MGALLPLLLQFAPLVIQGVEKLFVKPNDPNAKLGTNKLDAVSQILRQLIDKLVASGVAPAPTTPITDDALHSFVETVLAQLKASGQLTAAAPAGELYVMRVASFVKLDGVQ